MLRTLLICTTLAVTACASAPKTAPTATASTDRYCVSSASRIPQSNCAPGRTYDKTDLDRTGQTNVAKALQMLDPAVH